MIDSTSLEILKILQEKARIPNVEVSRKIGLAPSAVLERIRKLEKNGIIDGYEVRLNPEQFHCSLVAFIYVQAVAGLAKQVEEKLQLLPEVQEIHFISGSDCYMVKVRTKNTSTLGQLVQENIQNLEGVLSTKTETALSTIKETNRIPLPKDI